MKVRELVAELLKQNQEDEVVASVVLDDATGEAAEEYIDSVFNKTDEDHRVVVISAAGGDE